MVRTEVREAVEGGFVQRLPDRALGELRVAAQHPDVVRELVQLLARQGDADGDGQALAEGAGRDVDPRDRRRRVALQA